jgi:glycosyltransferase involved in cell wall biosynthesis
MKILISAYACEPYKGSEPYVGWNWAIQMSKYNEIYVLTRANNKKNIDKYFQENKNEKLHFIYYDLPKIFRLFKKGNRGIHIYYKIWQILTYYKVKKIIKYEKFDIIHHLTFNEFRTPSALWKFGIPFIWGPIGGAQEFPEGFDKFYKFNFKYRCSESIRKMINSFYINSNGLVKVYSKSSYVLFATQCNYDILYNDVLKDKSAILLETGIDKIKPYNKDYKSKDKISFLWVGNLIYRKALGLLLEAIHILKQSNTEYEEKYEFNIIGDGPLKSIYEEYCKENKLNNVKFIGKVNHKDVDNYYKDADVFIFTSLRDTSGNVVLEAMANSLPVIVIDHQGVKDIVDKKSGIKIKPKNAQYVINELVDSIIKLGDESEIRMSMGTNGRNIIEQKYLWETKAKIMQDIYEKVCKSNK